MRKSVENIKSKKDLAKQIPKVNIKKKPQATKPKKEEKKQALVPVINEEELGKYLVAVMTKFLITPQEAEQLSQVAKTSTVQIQAGVVQFLKDKLIHAPQVTDVKKKFLSDAIVRMKDMNNREFAATLAVLGNMSTQEANTVMQVVSGVKGSVKIVDYDSLFNSIVQIVREEQQDDGQREIVLDPSEVSVMDSSDDPTRSTRLLDIAHALITAVEADED